MAATARLAKLFRHVTGADTGDVEHEEEQKRAGLSVAATAAGTTVPALPLPTLQETCERFLMVVAPLCTPTELEEAKTSVEQLLKNPDAAQLQRHLEDEQQRSPYRNYMRRYWDTMYFEGRYPVPINSNPYFAFHPDACVPQQARQAARLSSAVARFVQAYRRGTRPADTDGQQPVCMDQYTRMWGTTRIPELTRDKLRLCSTSRHCLVLRNHRFYEVQLMDVDGNVYTVEQLEPVFQSIIDDDGAQPADPGAAIGILTTMDRDEWARYRRCILESDMGNPLAFDTLETALFSLTLDVTAPADITAEAKQYLCGGQPEYHPSSLAEYRRNPVRCMDGLARWYDKSVQFFVCANGKSGLNFEHSWGDGVALTMACHQILHELAGTASGFPAIVATWSSQAAPPAEQIYFAIPPVIRTVVSMAAASMAARVQNVDFSNVLYDRVTKAKIKRWKISPDAFAQMSMQLAVRAEMRGLVPDDLGINTYEPQNMRLFSGGRTETIRVVTPESQTFVKTFFDPKSTPQQVFGALQAASLAHRDRMNLSRDGKGIDRHLFCLRNAATELGVAMPSLFATSAYAKLNRNILSTSTILSDMILHAGFAAVDERGFGGGYMMHPTCMCLTIASYHVDSAGSPTNCSARRFMNGWVECLDRMANICDACTAATP